MASSGTHTSVEQVEQIQLSRWNPSRSQTQTSKGLVLGHDVSEDILIQELKPVDGGITAWTVLITAFVFEAILWGKHNASLLPDCHAHPQPWHQASPSHSESSKSTIPHCHSSKGARG